VASFTSGALNGNELPVGHAVVADTRAVRVEHPGRATWTLAPGSSGHIAAQGRYLTVALARGSVLAEVVPGQAAESFAVEARETRIAAHGTVFRVTLDGDQVDVQVSEGEVVVGSAEDRGETRGFHLAAPGHGTFPLDGARVGRISPPSEGVEAPQQQLPLAAPPPRQPARPPLPVASSQAPAAAGPTVETVTDRIVEELRSCFVRNTQVQGSVHVSATSTISVTFVGGSVDRLQIDPPLAPDVERCVRAAAHGVSIPNGAEATVSREVWLSR
jgi:hypothetical protein